jgi:4-amino-4-deoxy-L-arabinose transferase-like glycosyltransferase
MLTCAPDSRRRLAVWAGLAAIVFLLLFGRAMHRPLDLDEHQFVAPPLLLAHHGLIPYRDFPYFHMPNLVGIYAALALMSPWPLLAARTLSVLCGTATVLLLFATGWRLLPGAPPRARWLVTGGIASVYMTSRLFTYTNGWAWNHDTAVLCTLGAFLLHTRGLRQGRPWYFTAAGLLLGMATGIRLSFALAVVPFALSLLLADAPALARRQRWLGLAGAILGALVALSPAIVLLAGNPDHFVFGNLGYAALSTQFYRASRHPSAMTLPGKLVYLPQTFLSDPGNALLLVLPAYALGWRFWRARGWRSPYRNELLLLLGLLPPLGIGALGPTPTQYQYYYMLLPFLALAILYTIAADAEDRRTLRRWVRVVACGAVLAAGIGLPRWYWPVVYLPRPHLWTPLRVHAAGEWLKATAPQGARVLTIDPLIPLEAGMAVYPDYAVGRFVLLVGPFTTAEQRQRYRLTWGDRLYHRLTEEPPDVIFYDRRVADILGDVVVCALFCGYHAVDSPDGTCTALVRPASTPPSSPSSPAAGASSGGAARNIAPAPGG